MDSRSYRLHGRDLAGDGAAMLLTPSRFVDLDGPLLLARDRDGGLRYTQPGLSPEAALWDDGRQVCAAPATSRPP